jgi:DNA end-binding protein Ku
MWKGFLSFGLVNIPVHMYTASKERELSFILLHKKDHSQIHYARICKTEGKEVPWNEIVKGFEFEKGEYVIVTDEDFAKANLRKSKTIEIINFIDEDEVDPIYYVKPYYLEPDKNAQKAYSLLREALKKSKKVGLAKFALRNKEHIGLIKPHENMLIVNELRYQTELLKADDLKLSPEKKKISSKELDIAIQLIDQLTVPFEPKRYKDSYVQEMKKIIRQKAKGRTIHPSTDAPKSTKVTDIMSLLQASLETDKKSAKRTRARHTALQRLG